MKTTNTIDMKPVCVYRNEAHETKTRREMETCKTYMQAVADEWLALGIGDVTNINDLMMRPRPTFDNKVNAMIDVPKTDGKFAVKKSAYMDTLALPDPSALINACNIAKQQTWCGVPGLWDMDENKVVLNEDTAAQFIDSQSIYVSDPVKAEFVKDVNDLCALINKVNARTNGELINPMDMFLNRWAVGKFIIRQHTVNDTRIEPDADAIKRWLSLI